MTWWGDLNNRKPYVFLTRAPLTFGHSQLVVPDTKDEAEGFTRGRGEILKVIRTFGRAFGENRSHEKDQYRHLAAYTQTSGDYVKTLILRVSASENPTNQFKVHLAPYFTSHQILCQARFAARQNFLNKKDGKLTRGGLIGWLGEREDFVQALEDDFLRQENKENETPLAVWADNNFHLKELAEELKVSEAISAASVHGLRDAFKGPLGAGATVGF